MKIVFLLLLSLCATTPSFAIETAAPTTPISPTSPPPAAPPEAKPVIDVKPAPSAPEAAGVKVDVGSAKLNLLLQPWFVADSTSTAAKNNFRARRTEVKLSGNLNPDSRWFVMFDPAKSLKTGAVASSNDNKILQDLGAVYQPLSGFEVTGGQFKIPTTAEGLDPSGDLPLPERSLMGRTYGDKRQLGGAIRETR